MQKRLEIMGNLTILGNEETIDDRTAKGRNRTPSFCYPDLYDLPKSPLLSGDTFVDRFLKFGQAVKGARLGAAILKKLFTVRSTYIPATPAIPPSLPSHSTIYV